MLMAILNDQFYHRSNRYNGKYFRLWTVRAFAYNDKGNLIMLHLKDDNGLGKRDCLETLGGKVYQDESLSDAIKRVVLKQTGCDCDIKKHLGYIVDHYNALNRETISNYFIVELKDKVGEVIFENQEEGKIADLEEVEPHKLISKLENVEGGFNKLITRRDEVAYDFYKKNAED